MSLFRKPKKNVRTRGPVGQEDSGDEVEVLQVNITNLKKEKKEKKEKKKKREKEEEKKKGDKKTLLSFDEEGKNVLFLLFVHKSGISSLKNYLGSIN